MQPTTARKVKRSEDPVPEREHGPERRIDGTQNNLDHPRWGAAGERLRRLAPSEYADGRSAPAGPTRAHPRAISNRLCAQPEPTPDPRGRSEFVWAWGQFLDHELDLTLEATPAEDMSLAVPDSDPDYAGRRIPFARSRYDPASGHTTPREQVNAITSYIDASNVYGSDDTRAAALRTHTHGLLKTGPGPDGPLLPKNDVGLPNAGGHGPSLFLAGDVRANEHVVLSSMHALFVREHNRLCREIVRDRPDWTDDQIYQRARKLVGGLMQVITYNEFLPALIGPRALQSYAGYDDTVNVGVSNEFSTVAYRVGHSMVGPVIPLARGGRLALRDGFFRPGTVDAMGIEPFLEGLAFSRMQRIDVRIVDDLRSFLFRRATEAPGQLLDLAALNIQRGRDHGIATYNACRDAFGLARRPSFSEITTDPFLQRGLAELYDGVDQIDPWIGGLAEDPCADAAVGEFFSAVLVDQFTRARDGDWYWYENDPALSVSDRQTLNATTLSGVIQRNTGLQGLPSNVFVATPTC